MRLRGGKLTLDEYVRKVEGLIEDKIRTRAATEISLKFFIRSFAAMVKMADDYEHLTSTEDNLRVARHFQEHTLRTAKKLGVPTNGWEDVRVRILDGSYPIFPGIRLAFTRIQDFWVREQRGESSGGYGAVVGGCSAGFRDDFAILADGQVTTCCVDYDGKNVIGDLRKLSLMQILDSAEAKQIRDSFLRFRPPTQFCRECLGGPTLSMSLVKQIASIGVDIRDRLHSRKNYDGLRERLGEQGGKPKPEAILRQIEEREMAREARSRSASAELVSLAPRTESSAIPE